MFHRKSKAIVPYPNSPIKNISNDRESSSTAASISTNTDILDQMRNTQQITNEAYITIALLKEILLKLNQVEYNTRSSAVSSEFLGKYVLNKFKWF